MYFVYILRSDRDQKLYIGFTMRSPEERVVEHQHGLVDSTRHRRPIELVYYEAYSNEAMARKRELDLKKFGSAYQGLVKRVGLT